MSLRFPSRISGAVLLSLAIQCAAVAQTTSPIGGEFQVNRFTQTNQQMPAVDVEADGDFVIVWTSYQGFAKPSVFGQRFTSAGVPVGFEFQINASTTESHAAPSLAFGPGETFVVAWTANLQDGSSYGIFARRLSSSGAALATEFRVNGHTLGNQKYGIIASDADGDFVVVWEGPGASDPSGVFGRRFNSAGTALASEFRANSATTDVQSQASVDMDAAGNFVVVWTSALQDGSATGVFGQRFTSTGAFTGPEFQVNVYATGQQFNPDIGLDTNGDFIVAWTDSGHTGDAATFARRFDSAGTPLEGEFQVTPGVTGDQFDPSVTTDSDGDFVVGWQGYDGANMNVFAKRFKSSGLPASGNLRVNTYLPEAQFWLMLASDTDGDFVATWVSVDQDGDALGIFAQRFDVTASIDVDGDGLYLPLTDGLLLLRFGFGFSGSTLITGVVGAGCTRCDAPSIVAHLQSLL